MKTTIKINIYNIKTSLAEEHACFIHCHYHSDATLKVLSVLRRIQSLANQLLLLEDSSAYF